MDCILRYTRYCFFIVAALVSNKLSAQNCPSNIDFESGNFNNWQCYTGTTSVSAGNNVITVTPSAPVTNRHTIIGSSSAGVNDQYGGFPVRCPNGSNYSIKLGNNATGSQAERVSYKFTIPPTQTQFSLIYYYAVVFQDPLHPTAQQPRFTANIIDSASNNPISCATFNFVATSNLPGFQQSTVSSGVWYKTWTPVTINLSGLNGHTIKLEFTTADCTQSGHFGYAYIDVNAGCSTPVTGEVFCAGASSMTMQAPFGYQTYTWYNGNFIQIGNQQSLTLTPPPAPGTVIAVDVVPYSGFGCRDTIYSVVSSQPKTLSTSDTSICQGQPYTLPWGTTANTTGIYRDTIRYRYTGCDSLIKTVNLTVHSPVLLTLNPAICTGSSYTLPWGTVITDAGVYRDTLHYTTTGCDSVRRVINLIVQSPSSQIFNPIFCEGQPYTLPSGLIVSVPGVYRDTLHYTTGCDSVRRTFNLSMQSSSLQTFNPVLCAGQNYTLPWGPIVNAPGVYRDTLHYITGCDSVRRMVNLTVQSTSSQTFNPFFCEGHTYTLPSGIIVNVPGVYRDTLRYTTGCDSVRRTFNLSVQTSSLQTFNPVICAGQTYTLPWGTIVSATGVYRDTLHYNITGCDSIRRMVNLAVQTATSVTTNPIICTGQTYTLPWGAVVNASGIYRDTLHYTVTGCDSIRRIVNLNVQSPASVTINAVICQGASYTLPSGGIVNTTGTYLDTLHYTTGCDSVRRRVNLQVTAAAVSITNPVICSDETYRMPWGAVINRAGIYKDTLRTLIGCDSLIRTVNLTVNPVPLVSVNKSNDINCVLGTANLQATGGANYIWTPAGSLSKANIYNPVAWPSATTVYKVVVISDKGCTSKDSIEVKVIPGNTENIYPIPNAFTPNGDGRNDCFGVMTWGAVTNFEFTIYSRWGVRVFYTTDPKQCWDGRYKGSPQNADVFVYIIKANGLCGNVYRRGTFVLIR